MTSTRPLTQMMRAALVDRGWVKYPQMHGLEVHGLAVRTHLHFGSYAIKLTEAGEVLREEILAPLTPDVRVRNTITGLVGTVIRVERSERSDTVVLIWDGSEHETCGSPVYLEVIDDRQPEHAQPRKLRDRGLVTDHWLEITPAGVARLASHLRVGLDLGDDAILRGFVEAFVQDLER